MKGWHQIVINTNAKEAQELSDILWEIGALSTSFVDHQDTPIFEPLPGETLLWQDTDLVSLFSEDTDMNEVINLLINNFKLSNLNYQISFVEDKDWTREWMENFKPMCFGKKLWIYPSWIEATEPEQVVVKLDPGLAFGTGTHNTTRLCLQYLDTIDLKDKIVIDYGCGSGILAIAALKLGAKKAIGVDIDPQALEASLWNAENNQVADKLELFLAKDFNLEAYKESADVLVANILAGPLVELYPTLNTLVKPSGLLAMSGILKEKGKEIIACYEQSFILENQLDDEDWCRINGQKI